ncbi:hypothetical protein KC939_00630 [Candidatus Saccharibacteria bacterium]|nr:hypothetical protein [Candidatus Saccharibacteria bacterium]
MQPEDEQKNYWQPEEGAQQEGQTVEQPAVDAKPLHQEEAPIKPEQPQKYDDPTISWEASEYIYREKDFLWFLALGIITLAFLAFSIFILNSWTFAVLIAVMAAALIVYSRRPPRTLQYTLSPEGLNTGQKLHSFKEFKAFGVVQDGPIYSIMLVPTKRFAPMMNVYFAAEDGEKIVDIFGHHLPMEQLKLDFVDTLMRKLRL